MVNDQKWMINMSSQEVEYKFFGGLYVLKNALHIDKATPVSEWFFKAETKLSVNYQQT